MAKKVWFWRSLCGLILVVAATSAGAGPAAAQTKTGKKVTPGALVAHILTLAPGKDRDDAVDQLIELGADAWPEVRGRLDALAATMGGDDVLVDVLLGLAPASVDELVARSPKLSDAAAVRVARAVLRYAPDVRQLQILEQFAKRDDDTLLLLVLPEVLSRDAPVALARLTTLVDDKRANVRAYAIDMLVAKNHTPARPVLVRLLGIEQLKPTTDNIFVRQKLIHAIARLGADAAVPPLMEALDVADQREAVLDGLLTVGAPAVQAAVFMLRTADRSRIETALGVLSHLRLQAAPALLPLVTASDERTRELAIDILSHLAVPEVRAAIIKLVKERRFTDLRRGVLLALALYDESVRQMLVDMLTDPNVPVRQLAIEQLWRLADPETFSALRRTAGNDADQSVRMLALQAAVGVGDPKALELARQMVAVPYLKERLAVLDLLGRADGAAAIPALAAQLSDPSDEVFRMAQSALRRITFHQGPRREAEWLSWADGERGRSKEAYEEISPDLHKYAVEDREMAWLEAGSEDPTIIVLSGPPFRDATHLAPHVWRLAGDHRVAVMKRGVGPASATTISEAEMTLDLQKLLAAIGKRPVVLLADGPAAHFAIAYSVAHPKDVSRIILHGGPWPTAAALQRLPGEVAGAVSPLWRDDLTWGLQQHALLVPSLSQPAVWRAVLTAILADAESGRRVRTGNLFDDGFTIDVHDRAVSEARASDPARVNVKTCLLLGAKAPWAASTQKDIEALTGSAKKLVQLFPLKQAGGMPLVDDPRATLQAIAKCLED